MCLVQTVFVWLLNLLFIRHRPSFPRKATLYPRLQCSHVRVSVCPKKGPEFTPSSSKPPVSGGPRCTKIEKTQVLIRCNGVAIELYHQGQNSPCRSTHFMIKTVENGIPVARPFRKNNYLAKSILPIFGRAI